MAVSWRLKTYLANEHGIYRATELRKKIIKETNIQISKQQLCNLLNDKPRSLKLKTIEIICTALNCKLSHFCDVNPGKIRAENLRKLSYENTPHKTRCRSDFPDPRDYE